MAERREWAIYTVLGHAIPIEEYDPDYMPNMVLVREVLPGDDDLLDPRCDDVIELLNRHAALVEAAKAVFGPIPDPFENEDKIGVADIDALEALRKTLENEDE